jgi:flagellar protein FlaJ
MPKKERKTEKVPEDKRDLLTAYAALSYRAVGGLFERARPNLILQDNLRKANLPLTAPVYLSIVLLTGIIAIVASLAVSILVFLFLLNLDGWLFFVLGMVALSTVAALAIFPLAMSIRISNRKSKIDRELPFTLSELSILASTGLSPIEVIRRMAQRNVNPAMSGEFRRIVFKIDVEGKDLITALGEVAKESPSELLRGALWDMSNMIHQGGNLDLYLRAKADEIMNLKRSVQKEFIDRLTTLSDIYVSLVLIGVLFISIGAFFIDAMGTTIGGIDANTLLLLLTYFIIPVSVFAVAMIASSAYSKAE